MSLEAKNAKEIFLVAVENYTPDKWEAYLDGACGDDARLRERVEILLRAHQGEDTFLDRQAGAVDQRINEQPGTKIGNYKLMEQIGEGGMGVVYVAQQEHPVQRKVALKVIKPGMDTMDVIARFEAERQALALMDHPSIARVLDAGATESGHPYFVMELVRGISITEYCDRARLGTRERLELFVTVCQAIQHAHQKGVIHRDVKPSNVLVTELDGTPLPKVIDFGVAKATNRRLTEMTIYTRHQEMVGTPLYMSPEQAELSALDVDTRTDIYSLGVLLYELLTGATPFERRCLHEAAYDEMRRIIREEDPPRPSTRISTLGEATGSVCERRRTDPRKLGHVLRGDLDWIVMKALEKDRSRRYETAAGFSLDVQRFLNEETVEACPPSVAYSFSKFVRRHRSAVVAALSMLLLLCAGVVGTTTSWIDAIHARHQAQEERDRAVQATADLRNETYAGAIALAYEAIRGGDLGRAQTLLRRQRPGPEEEDLRGFEWRHLWARSHGNYTMDLGRFEGFLGGLSVSPDGQFVALNRDKRLEVIDLASGIVSKTIESGVHPMTYSPSGRLLVGETREHEHIVGWNTGTWEAMEPLRLGFPLAFGHRTEPEIFVAVAREGDHPGDHLSVWNATEWKKIGDLANSRRAGKLLVPGYGMPWHMTNTLAISSDDRFAYLAGAKGIRRWDLERHIEVAPFELGRATPKWGEGLACVATSGHGQLAVGDRWGQVHLIDPQSGEVLHTFASHIGWVSCLKFARNGTRLVSSGADRTVVVYDPKRRSVVDRLLGHREQVWGLDVSADGETVVSGAGYGDHVLTWSLGELGGPVSDLAGITRFKVLSDGRILVHRNKARDLEVYDPTSGAFEPAEAERFVRTLAESGTHAQAASPDGRWILFPDGNELVVWNIHTDRRERTLSPPFGRIDDMNFAFSPDSRLLVGGGGASEVRLWRTGDWSSAVLNENAGEIQSVSFSRDSRRVALSRGTIRVFDLAGGTRQILALQVEPAPLSVALSSSGRLLAAGFPEGVIRVWDLQTNEKIKTLAGHIQGVFSLSFAPDDRTLASASSSATVKLWHVPTWRQLMSVPADADRVQFSPDGRYLAAMVLRSGADVFRGEGAGLRIVKAPGLAVIDANSRSQP